jgi:V/A-type H+/Na+-transporting ATPase subunit I
MIAPMDRIEIVCLRSILDDVTLFLQWEGILHVEEVPLDVENAPDFLHRAQLNPEQQARADALVAIQRMLGELTPLLTVKPPLEEVRRATAAMAAQDLTAWHTQAQAWRQDFRALTHRKVSGQDRLEVLDNYRKVLGTVAPVMEGRDVRLGEGARVLVLQGDVRRVLERLESKLERDLPGQFQLIREQTSRRSAVALILYDATQDAVVAQILEEEGIVPLDMRGDEFEGATVSEMLPRIAEAIAKQRADLNEVQLEIEAFSRDHAAAVTALDGLVYDALSQLNVINRFAHSEMVAVIHGWAPSEAFEQIKSRLHEKFPRTVEVGRLPMDPHDLARVPTLLKNSAWAKPFEVLLTIFRPPTYGTYDPTLLVGISFILFYGFVLGDAIYGVVVIAFAHLLRKKLGHIPLVNYAGKVGYYMGASSIVFGILYGEYAGSFGEEYLHLHYVWFHRAHEAERLLLYGILFGVVHIPLALIMGIWQDFRHHHTRHAQEKLGLLLGLVALGIFICHFMGVPPFTAPVFAWISLLVFLAGAALLVVALKAMALIQMLEIISLFGNVMSYSRLMAVGIASITLAEVANQLGHNMHPLIGVPTAIMIHLANVGIGIFSPTLHSLRLNYVEFLPKFFSPQGKVYQPFRKEKLC